MPHTPGPWVFGGDSKKDQTVVYAINPYQKGEEWIADCNTGHHSAAECVANARLIAQAPAMLECLRAFAEMYPPRPGLTGYFDRARALLRAVEEEKS